MMSEGIMSGVNCTRPCVSDSACASALTSNVLPSPGTPSISTCPEAASDATTCSMTSDCPTTAWLIAVRRRSSSSAARWIVLDSISMSGPCVLDQNSTARGFEQLNGGAQMLPAARAGVVQGGCKCIGFEPGCLRQRTHALGARKPVVCRDVQRRYFVQSAGSSAVQRFSAPDANRKLTRAADLLGQRAPRDISGSCKRTESGAVAPQCQRDQHHQQTQHRPAELPCKLEQRGMVALGKEMNLIAPAQLGRRDEQSAVVIIKQAALDEGCSVDQRDAATADCDAHGLQSPGGAGQGPTRSASGFERRHGVHAAD